MLRVLDSFSYGFGLSSDLDISVHFLRFISGERAISLIFSRLSVEFAPSLVSKLSVISFERYLRDVSYPGFRFMDVFFFL